MTEKANFLDFIYPITEDFFANKVVLDTGCGMGRFLKLAAEFGSDQVIGVDLSQSVDVAYHHTRTMPNAHVIQADLMNLPLRKSFDYIFSVGVLQFLEHPDQGFSKLVDLLKENGRISIWVYSQENNNWAMRFVSPLRINITSRLPHSVLFFLSHVSGFILNLCLQLIYRPANDSQFGRSLKLSRYLPYNEYLYYTSRLPYQAIASIIFDHLAPRLTVYISKKELQSWMDENSLSQVSITSRNNMSWRGLGTLSN
jgi:SAM-dependent methyltransferase